MLSSLEEGYSETNSNNNRNPRYRYAAGCRDTSNDRKKNSKSKVGSRLGVERMAIEVGLAS